MRFPKEYMISHGWVLLPVALVGLLVAFFAIFSIGGFGQNNCTGLSYFSFVDHRADSGSYMIQLVNGNQPVIIRSVQIGSVIDYAPEVSQANIQPGRTFTVRSMPMGLASGMQFRSTALRVEYDIINGETNRTDSAFCSGRVI
jgi:hypothetical protein